MKVNKTKQAFFSGAKYYEIFSDSRSRLEREGHFLKKILSESPGNKVVDIACGTGLHAAFFADIGANVDAFDISGEMIKHARKYHNSPKIKYSTGDMRNVKGGLWDMALCIGNSLSVLETNSDLRKTFSSVFNVLSLNGLFLIQILNYNSVNNQKPHQRIEERKYEERDIIAVKNLVPYRNRTLLSLIYYDFHEGDTETVSETVILMNWTLKDLISVAEETGFILENIYGGFDFSEYDSEISNDLVCVLKKQAAVL